MNGCYCNSQKEFKDCCEPYIKGLEKAPTAEALIRSRYSAYATHLDCRKRGNLIKPTSP